MMKCSTAALRMLMIAFGITMIGMLIAGGCSKDDTTAPQTSTVPTVDSDVFESVIAAIAEDNGGIVDQVADLAAIADGADSLASTAKPIAGVGVPVYDSATSTWQVQVMRQRGSVSEPFHATYTRTYRYQYRDQSGEPLQHRVVGADTACSVSFEIVAGNGSCHTTRLSQQVMSMTGTLQATGVDTDTIVISGTCTRTGVDTLTSYQSVRTLEYQLELTFANVRCLRGQSEDISQQVRGDLSGNYIANVAFMSGYTYGETNITRTMEITMEDGRATLSIGDGSYSGDLATGTP
ncbi:MAG: hypothetical protein PHR28_05060 [candidate division Zixibacteria bacterium]|nr:hypothetical protein [candidate division Zixibacteria bacterium]